MHKSELAYNSITGLVTGLQLPDSSAMHAELMVT